MTKFQEIRKIGTAQGAMLSIIPLYDVYSFIKTIGKIKEKGWVIFNFIFTLFAITMTTIGTVWGIALFTYYSYGVAQYNYMVEHGSSRPRFADSHYIQIADSLKYQLIIIGLILTLIILASFTINIIVGFKLRKNVDLGVYNTNDAYAVSKYSGVLLANIPFYRIIQIKNQLDQLRQYPEASRCASPLTILFGLSLVNIFVPMITLGTGDLGLMLSSMTYIVAFVFTIIANAEVTTFLENTYFKEETVVQDTPTFNY